ncbi:hypothetical protein G7A72_03290 [Flavobacterium sp. Sr18]|uniref:hypothetical protein n=1 Tax=Flavobacterium sp. Sr18 TaxID=935222 RepID=UPI0013E4B4CB|nr:hypothetical protein [Flavobacterium sp. Sr18]QIH37883.1 hypothetical protein G7A72_03290 [Flavobacterium sp. Sr18]
MNKQRLEQILNIPFSELVSNSELQTELTDYYKFIYNVKVCTSCKNKFPTYYKKLVENGVEKLTAKTESNFKLRDNIGVLQINFGDGNFISQTYAPDDLCIGFLKDNPARISLFEKYPENWMELIQKNNENETENE